MDQVVAKPKLATAWLGGCSGCHMSFLDLDERLIELADRVEICATPITDWKDFPPVDVTLIEGAVASHEHLEQARLIRERSRVLISFGDCAVTGNVTALRNMYALEDVLDRAYRDTATTIIGRPGSSSVLPRLLDRVRPLHEVVRVDQFLQGCPPSAEQIWSCITRLLDGVEQPPEPHRFG